MDRIRTLAVLSVRRACGFAGLAIVTVMFSLATDPHLSLKSGAVLTTLAAAVLAWKTFEAPTRNHRRTELWIMLERTPEWSDEQVGRLINGTLRDVYLWHAERAGVIALVLWLVLFAAEILG